jgi:hypothetical protein
MGLSLSYPPSASITVGVRAGLSGTEAASLSARSDAVVKLRLDG